MAKLKPCDVDTKMQMMATSVKGVVSTGLGLGETLDVGEDTQDIWQEALSRTHRNVWGDEDE